MRRWRLTPLLAVSLFLTACESDSPTAPVQTPAPPPAASGLTLQISGSLGSREDVIRRTIQETYDRVRALLDVDPMTIRVNADASRAIPGYGIGGFAPDGFTTDIAINLSFPDLDAVLVERLEITVAHELHHNARWRGPGYGTTLLQHMISEGLADHFAVETLGVALPPWSRALSDADVDRLLDRARPELDSSTFDRSGWFFGTRVDIPRWTGYTLGYVLVERFQATDGRSAAELVNTDANAFRP